MGGRAKLEPWGHTAGPTSPSKRSCCRRRCAIGCPKITPSEKNFEALEERQIEGMVAQQRESKADKKAKKKKKIAGAASERLAKRLEEPRGKQQYARRKGMAETAFGWVKQTLGFRQFLLQGLRKVQGEWSLVTLALNLRRMAAMEAAAAAA